jgi:hypothetical protein
LKKLEEAGKSKTLTEEEVVIVAYVTAKVDMQLRSMRKGFSSPEDYGKGIFKQIGHKDKLIAASLLLNISDLDPKLLYRPEKLREIAAKQLQLYLETDNYNASMTSEKNVESMEIGYQDMTRALKELDKVIGLENFNTKSEIKKQIKMNQKMRFSGSPSAYKLPSDISVLHTILSNPIMVKLIIQSLTRTGLVDYLAFFSEGFLHAIKLSQESGKGKEKENMKHLLLSSAKSSPAWNKIGPPDKSYVENFCKFISIFDDAELRMIARDVAESMVQNPELCCNILISFLLKSPEKDKMIGVSS